MRVAGAVLSLSLELTPSFPLSLLTFFVLQTSTYSLPGTVQGAESTEPTQHRSEMVLALLKLQSSRQERHHARNRASQVVLAVKNPLATQEA